MLNKLLYSLGIYSLSEVFYASHIVKAILGLHSLGYCCKDMEADHIVVVEENKSISAKIWHFKKCSSGMFVYIKEHLIICILFLTDH